MMLRRPMTMDAPAGAPADDGAILWRRLFRLWAVMTVVWAFMAIWVTDLACALGSLSAPWCTVAPMLSPVQIAYDMLALPFCFLLGGLLVRGLLIGARALLRLLLGPGYSSR